MARYPRQIRFIIGNEACERFSFYGMRNILTVFLINHLLANDYASAEATGHAAKSVFHTFVMGVHFFPLLGGWLADRYLGKYRTIFYLSILYCVGQFLLATFWQEKPIFYAGLCLIALGAGGIKPCVSAFVGDQFDESNKQLARSIFGLFYWIINFGSFFASLTIPVLLVKFGPTVAFGVPGVLMAISTLILWTARKRYVHIPPRAQSQNQADFWGIIANALVSPRPADAATFLDRARARYGATAVAEANTVLKVLPFFLLVSVFWAIFDQKASTVVIQGARMGREFGNITLHASQMQAINPLLVMLLIPFLNLLVYPRLSARGRMPSALKRMTYGILLAGVAFAIVAAFEFLLEGGTTLHISWQLIPYLVLTLAEVLVSTTGLEFAYSQAPLSMKGVLMSLWTLTVTLGNFLVVIVTTVNVFQGALQILFFAFLAGLAAALFARLARSYVPTEHFRSKKAA